MAKKRLAQYSGMLTPSEVAEGMNLAIKNARRLLEDAELMLKHDRVPSALALAILSMEESGKVSILRAIALSRTQTEAKKEWANYRRHTEKNRMWIFPEIVVSGGRHLEDFRAIFDETADHPQVLDQLKQISFYTDCLGQVRWTSPQGVVEKDLATSLVKVARLLCSKPNHTTREIELWVKHLQPVWKTSMAAMKGALVRWAADMAIEGMDEFVYPTLTHKN